MYYLKNRLISFFFLFIVFPANKKQEISKHIVIYHYLHVGISPEKDIKMAHFNPVFEETKQWEGGYQNNPNDDANYNSLGQLVGTNKGISAVGFEAYYKRPATVADMQNLDYATSREIFKANYWDKIGGDQIRSQDIARIIFGTYIGNIVKTNQAVKYALEQVGHPVDQVKSPYSREVIQQINRSNPEQLFYAIKDAQLQFVVQPMQQSGSQFYAGWNRKVSSFEFEGSKKKWILASVILIALISGSYYLYKKAYFKKINFR